MNYLEEYYKIIDYRIKNKLEISLNTELHHITPRGFFDKGSPKEIIDREENLVYLTCQEHFLVHYYLKEYYKELKESKHKDYNKRYYLVALKGFNAMGMKSTNNENRIENSKLFEESKIELYKLYKEENIIHIKEICEFINNNDRFPSKNKDNEKLLHRRLYYIKSLKKSKSHLFYKEYQDIANNYKLFGLFDNIDREKIGLNRINELCDFIDLNNKIPKSNTNNKNEKSLFEFMSQLKQSKLGKGTKIWFNSYQQLLDERGYSTLLDINNTLIQECLEKINNLCDWIDENNKFPTKDEKLFYNFITNMKESKDNKNTIKWYNVYQELLDKRGYPSLFDKRDKEQEGLNRINEICDFIDINGRPRTKKSKNVTDYEKLLNNRINNFKKHKKKKSKSWFETYQKLLDERGYSILFDFK